MADKQKRIYFAQVDGEDKKAYRSSDPRLVRRHILAGIYPPEIKVWVPEAEEAMNAAIDGIVTIDIVDQPDGAPAADLLTPVEGEAPKSSIEQEVELAESASDAGLDEPRLNPDDLEPHDRVTGEIIEEAPLGEDEPF